jgi:hypothetical protein
MVINFQKTTDILIPAQLFITPVLGTVINDASVSIKVRIKDVSDNTDWPEYTVLATRTARNTWFKIAMALGPALTGSPAPFGAFRPGHRYIMSVQPATANQFIAFNLNEFGCIDGRLNAISTWPRSLLSSTATEATFQWKVSAWDFRRTSAMDGSWSGPVQLFGTNGSLILDESDNLQPSSALPETIIYDGSQASAIRFAIDGNQLLADSATSGGIADNTKNGKQLHTITGANAPTYTLYDLNASSLATSTMSYASGTQPDGVQWWVGSVDISNQVIRAAMKADRGIIISVSSNIMSPVEFESSITLDSEKIALLPYRFVWRNSVLRQEFGKHSAPSSWYKAASATGLDDANMMCYRELKDSSNANITIGAVINFWNPAVKFSSLTWVA